jgi:hypothetical protein
MLSPLHLLAERSQEVVHHGIDLCCMCRGLQATGYDQSDQYLYYHTHTL